MNANELADALETMTTGWFDDLTLTQAATMLRQQQTEIEALKTKTLTNEEISDIRDKFFAPDGCNIYTFARALLKKANEI
jgi:DNA-binding transcriptional regulator YiaG